ncbi:glycosyltransferase family 2 protein [Algoriphagus sp. CAU 1675]|uniref:glycosyltransferase family 2 protein n=1 Tax=Algoriphagus sp. CAU 1675 TaxID=3032597 RepID=UPI0023DCC592|nr:glycosyltransferase family 2 protein [Algoriphagus sp. CAU 1675]MDF2157534.1 glycosyltransferase family 2 protein [Algoriphagus sp. CAU 1675]
MPKISLLVAARNESRDLPALLKSLEELDYPKEKIQFLFADDQSEDNTAEILEEWCIKRDSADWINIGPEEAFSMSQNPKANALSILERKAEGEIYLFTDADCRLPKEWARVMVSCFKQPVGMVLGVTQVGGRNWFSVFQAMDWWNTLGFVKLATDLGLSTTGLGNNMGMSQEAYRKSGGFSGIDFSLTEDLEISKSVRKAGFQVVHQVCGEVLVKTKAERSLLKLLNQRKRWMGGVMTLPWYWKLILGLQFLYFPALAVLIGTFGFPVLLIAALKMALQALFFKVFAKKAEESIGFFPSLLFDFYFLPVTLLTILYYFWPSKTEWKSRKYP